MFKSYLSLLILGLVYFSQSVNAQVSYDFGFVRSDSIVVLDSLGNAMDFPWVGGFNSVHFQEIDMNFDGIKDILVFDTHGDKKYTFINQGIAGQSSYKYEPKYEKLFPEMMSWVQLVDYNCDGKNDLFTYIPGGIAVYKNISTPATGIKFQMVTPMLNYIASNGMPINIYVSSVDFPAITDIDMDGDIDILTFSILGTFVIYYKNLSMEKYGDCSQLDFKEYDRCWGKFAENDSNNAVTLHVLCNYKNDKESVGKSSKHTGSTLMAHDLNNDSLVDLVLGDVDFLNLVCLYNGGTLDSAHIISQDKLFPSYDTSVNIISFPVMSYLDINNDSVKDMVASPLEPVFYTPQSYNSVWMYQNDGTDNNPIFHFKKKSFFQDQMIDVGDNASPRVVDVDGDGLQDIVITNYGIIDTFYWDPFYSLWSYKYTTMTWYKNVGSSTQPSFKLVDDNLFNIKDLHLVSAKATFGDLDGDGDKDMILGSNDGSLIYCQNIAGAGNMMNFAPPVMNYQNIDVGEFAAPKLFDIDGDSLLDLTIGTKSGPLAYYKNTGSQSIPQFTYVTDSMGHADVTNYWHRYDAYSVPEIYKDDNDSLVMMVGSSSGKVFYFRDIENNIMGQFGMDSNLLYLDYYDTLYSIAYFINSGNIMEIMGVGLRSAVAVYDFDNDGYKDMLVGNFSGGLEYFKGIQPAGVGIKKEERKKSSVNIYPNPAQNYIMVRFENPDDLKEAVVRLYNMQGKLMAVRILKSYSKNKLDFSNLPTGAYFIDVEYKDYNNKVNHSSHKLLIVND